MNSEEWLGKMSWIKTGPTKICGTITLDTEMFSVVPVRGNCIVVERSKPSLTLLDD